MAGVNADPVVEPAREAGLEFNSEAMLAVGKRSGLGEFMRMAHRRALARAAHEEELDADVVGRQAVQLDRDIDEKRFAELDAGFGVSSRRAATPFHAARTLAFHAATAFALRSRFCV